MKFRFNYLCYVACAISIIILIVEFIDTIRFYSALLQNNIFYYSGYKIQELINKEPGFREMQAGALVKKISKLFRELFAWFLLTMLLFTVTNSRMKECANRMCQYKMNVLGTRSLNCNRAEINFICVFLTTCLFAAYGNAFVRAIGKDFDTIASEAVFYVMIFTIVLPFIMALFYNLFRIFGSKLIIAFYLTFYIKATAEFFTQEDVDLLTFKKVEISQYSKAVQEYLTERSLQDRVYHEREKSDSINAALVGWGAYEHIEIYGDHKEFSNEEFESVLMHEIGHSQDYSLYKKVLALYVIKAIEFAVVWWLWNSAAEFYSNETLTKTGAFFVLVIIYEMYLNRYLMVLHKLTSQNAEINADLIAKKHGFAENLGKVLFKITVKSKEPIHYTFWYNALKSFHPSILRRVEYLHK
ncbi:hypothetical protein ECANGB1_313 [Enterospora canceri]|uniref:Peptidase M48 domain-containing protein n=1 Tax=Enterospora canceri TaxID=1081671 RepID=A0A1Y1S845_9MICR|nr:hypothetical protein ECANGB1_313 [Enterospora canceri]